MAVAQSAGASSAHHVQISIAAVSCLGAEYPGSGSLSSLKCVQSLGEQQSLPHHISPTVSTATAQPSLFSGRHALCITPTSSLATAQAHTAATVWSSAGSPLSRATCTLWPSMGPLGLETLRLHSSWRPGCQGGACGCCMGRTWCAACPTAPSMWPLASCCSYAALPGSRPLTGEMVGAQLADQLIAAHRPALRIVHRRAGGLCCALWRQYSMHAALGA